MAIAIIFGIFGLFVVVIGNHTHNLEVALAVIILAGFCVLIYYAQTAIEKLDKLSEQKKDDEQAEEEKQP